MFHKTLTHTAFIAALMTGSNSYADHINKDVPANKASLLNFLYIISESSSCWQPGKPKMDIIDAPQHGEIRFRWSTQRWAAMRESCKKTGINGMEIIYIPQRGYHGPDHVRIGAQFSQYANGQGSSYSSDTFNLTVK